MTLTPGEQTAVVPIGMPTTAPQTSGHPCWPTKSGQIFSRFAPEVTSAITQLMSLKDELRTFDRPMGPDQAIMLADGVRAIARR